eukprot:gb/GECH01008284.1/.p1 GENE.gb/GECH01008284.1/~~gb/GECH01008284.1/.p1  ORF type:complete len:210 (+),score=26.21 gb/GECH01008284.1/:1-630(+)
MQSTSKHYTGALWVFLALYASSGILDITFAIWGFSIFSPVPSGSDASCSSLRHLCRAAEAFASLSLIASLLAFFIVAIAFLEHRSGYVERIETFNVLESSPARRRTYRLVYGAWTRRILALRALVALGMVVSFLVVLPLVGAIHGCNTSPAAVALYPSARSYAITVSVISAVMGIAVCYVSGVLSAYTSVRILNSSSSYSASPVPSADT